MMKRNRIVHKNLQIKSYLNILSGEDFSVTPFYNKEYFVNRSPATQSDAM